MSQFTKEIKPEKIMGLSELEAAVSGISKGELIQVRHRKIMKPGTSGDSIPDVQVAYVTKPFYFEKYQSPKSKDGVGVLHLRGGIIEDGTDYIVSVLESEYNVQIDSNNIVDIIRGNK